MTCANQNKRRRGSRRRKKCGRAEQEGVEFLFLLRSISPMASPQSSRMRKEEGTKQRDASEKRGEMMTTEAFFFSCPANTAAKKKQALKLMQSILTARKQCLNHKPKI